MTSHERFARMFAHRDADRIPIIDEPWGATIERWWREGMPQNVDWVDFFDVDRVAHIDVDNSPRYEVRVLEDTPDYVVGTSPWGVTLKNWRHAASTPQFLAHTIVDRGSWEAAKARMLPTPDRVPWAHLEHNYRRWRREGYWIEAGLWFGFDVTHAWVVGTERLLLALAEDPEWCVDMFNTFLDIDLTLLDMVWERGYHFDSVRWPDDMGYKQNQFFSVRTYRELLKPAHRRAVEWAHAKGIRAHLHSCGDIRPFVPELVEIGVDALNPLEVKAGVDTLELKRTWGDRLVLHGGMNAVLWDDPEAIAGEMRIKIPELKRSGGYIFSSDHSVPSSVSLQTFRGIVALAKELGRY